MKIHRKHFGRDLFKICITCGSKNIKFKYSECNLIKYCEDKCKIMIHDRHLEYDCKNFIKCVLGNDIKIRGKISLKILNYVSNLLNFLI